MPFDLFSVENLIVHSVANVLRIATLRISLKIIRDTFLLLKSMSSQLSLLFKGGGCSCILLMQTYLDDPLKLPLSPLSYYKVLEFHSIPSLNYNKIILDKYLLSQRFTNISTTQKRDKAKRLVIDHCTVLERMTH